MIIKQSNPALPFKEGQINSNACENLCGNLKCIVNETDSEKILIRLSQIFMSDYKIIDEVQERIINTLSLMNSVITLNPRKSSALKPIVKFIINIAKDKLDLLRKNATLLLAKIAKSSEEMEKFVRELHGIDVIMNVAKFIKLEN